MNSRKTIGILLGALLTLGSMTACGGQQQSRDIRMDMVGGVQNMDPQFATEPMAVTLIVNTMEGLLRRDEAGQLVPGVAESYTAAPDGLSYRFTLRENARWQDGERITAEDFVFALRRLFNSQIPSPYAEEYLAIQNAPEVLSGLLGPETLGVLAHDAKTLEIRLSNPSPLFLERLAESPAMPCNQDFFTKTRARYGLEAEYLLSSGPYLMKSWDNAKSIVLRPNPEYWQAEEIKCPQVVFYTTRIITAEKATAKDKEKSAWELFAEKKSDLYLASAMELEKVRGTGATLQELKNRTWSLVINTREGTLENVDVRRALLGALNRTGYRERTPEMYGISNSLVPPIAQMEGSKAMDLSPWDEGDSKFYAQRGLAALGQEELGRLTLLVPENAELDALGAYLQRQWNSALGAFINLERAPEPEFSARLAQGDFTLVLQPMETATQTPIGALEQYATGSQRNISGWSSPEFDALLGAAAGADSHGQAAQLFGQAEQLVLDNAVATPVLTQSSYFAYSRGTTGIHLAGGQLSFRNAFKTE